MKDNLEEKRPTRNVVIKLRFCKAEASIQKCKHKIARLNDIMTKLKLEKKRRQNSGNCLLNALAERKDNQIADYDARVGDLNARIVREKERKSYLLELDRLARRDRFNVYFSHLSDNSSKIGLLSLIAGFISIFLGLETRLSLIPMALSIIFLTLGFSLLIATEWKLR